MMDETTPTHTSLRNMTDDAMLLLAADTQTPSTMLTKLMHFATATILHTGRYIADEDDRLVQTLARNPNVVAENLNFLAWFAPAAVLENPVMPLFDLADPTWLGIAMLRRLVGYPTCPDHYRWRLAEWEQQGSHIPSPCRRCRGAGMLRIAPGGRCVEMPTTPENPLAMLMPCPECQGTCVPIRQKS